MEAGFHKVLFLLFLGCYKGLFFTLETVYGWQTDYQTCYVTLENCNYTLSLFPSDNCHQGYRGHHGQKVKHSRSQRSVSDDGVYQISNVLTSMDSLASEFERLEQKMSREMNDLSKRVLRGARKMETLMKTLASDTKSARKRTGRCPSGFVSVDNWPSCYMFSRFSVNWFEAIDYCTALGSDLVSLEEVHEHFLVTFLIRNNPGNKVLILFFTTMYIGLRQGFAKVDNIAVFKSYLKFTICSFITV